MPAVPTAPDFDDGIVDSSYLNRLAAAIQFAQAKPRCKAIQSVAQSLANNTLTVLTWNSVEFDDYVMWDAGLPSRITALYPGYYDLGGGASFAANATSYRFLRWLVNGSAISDSHVLLPPATGLATMIGAKATTVFLDIDDYVELQVRQATGGALNTSVGAGDFSSAVVTFSGI